MKKIPEAINIILKYSHTDPSKRELDFADLFYSIKYIRLKYSLLVPIKDFMVIAELLRKQKESKATCGYIVDFEIQHVNTFERYCRYIADHFSKEDIFFKYFWKMLSKGKNKRKYLIYLVDTIDFLIDRGVKGTPWTQRSLNLINPIEKIMALEKSTKEPF